METLAVTGLKGSGRSEASALCFCLAVRCYPRKIPMCALRFLTESVLARADVVRLREDVVKYERIAKPAGSNVLRARTRLRWRS